MIYWDSKVKDVCGLVETKGDFGIEIEMETNKEVYPDYVTSDWHVKGDDSLRGHSAELVLKKPIDHDKVDKVVDKLKGSLTLSDIKILDSVRASTHIHMNMQDSTIKDLFKFFMCYYPLETVLVNGCNEGRRGNLFCLRVRDAEYIHQALYNAIESNELLHLRTNNLRYSALNFQSLFTFGSVEFRAPQTDPNLDNIKLWCDVLKRLKEYSVSIPDCWGSIAKISGMGPREWAKQILGPELFKRFDYEGLDWDVMYDARNIQYVSSLLRRKGV